MAEKKGYKKCSASTYICKSSGNSKYEINLSQISVSVLFYHLQHTRSLNQGQRYILVPSYPPLLLT